ncbi:MAG: hypothetical protein NTY01_15765 [Verrucomicrobia bacterium]|nr:hypothetical protein [Verrucomicrobiota bacterium]
MNPEQDLEKLMERELRSLPPPRAPETLAPRVMAAITARATLPWHQRTWFEWPLGWQVASAALTVAFLAMLMMLAPWRALAGAKAVVQLVGQIKMLTASIGEIAERVLRIALPLWNALAQEYLIFALAVVTALAAAVAALGGAARQLVLKEI